MYLRGGSDDEKPGANMEKKVVVLTGGTAGIGVGLLRECVKHGAGKVYLLCRSAEKGAKVRDEVHAEYEKLETKTEIEIVKCEMSLMKDVKTAAEFVIANAGKIDVVFLNAGLIPGSNIIKTSEGVEEALAVNVCSAHLLARLLVPALATGARVIFTGSDAGKAVKFTVDLEALQGEAGMGAAGFMQYARTKTLMHMQAGALQDMLDAADLKVDVSVWHPGAVKTDIGKNISPTLLACIHFIFFFVFRSVDQAASFGMHLALSKEAVHRGYLADGDTGRPSIKRGLPAKLISGAEDSKKCLDAWQAVEAVVAAALGGASLPPLGQPKAGT